MYRAIAAVDQNFGIGYKNQLLFKIPDDMKFFRDKTKGNCVVMGRNTFESIGKPLPNRDNFVITSKLDLKNRNDIISGSPEDIDHVLKMYDDTSDIYIIGGAKIYELYMPRCEEIFLTMYDKAYDQVDAYFPDPNKFGFKLDTVIFERIYEYHKYKITKWIKG